MEQESSPLKYYMGCDVGKSGGIVLMDENGNIIEVGTMPTIGKEYDTTQMEYMMNIDGLEHIAIEDVHAFHNGGSTSNFQFGLGKGLLMGLAAGMSIPFTLVQPKIWQKECWEGVTKVMKPMKEGAKRPVVDTKATSLVAVKRLFPKQDLRKSERAKIPHDGIVDAILICEYIRRKFNK